MGSQRLCRWLRTVSSAVPRAATPPLRSRHASQVARASVLRLAACLDPGRGHRHSAARLRHSDLTDRDLRCVCHLWHRSPWDAVAQTASRPARPHRRGLHVGLGRRVLRGDCDIRCSQGDRNAPAVPCLADLDPGRVHRRTGTATALARGRQPGPNLVVMVTRGHSRVPAHLLGRYLLRVASRHRHRHAVRRYAVSPGADRRTP